MNALLGIKKDQSQRFLEDGKRIPVTLVDVKDNHVVDIKTNDRDHYSAVQLGFGIKKKASKSQIGHAKGAKLQNAPKFLREVRVVDDSPLPEIGSVLNPSEVFKPGDVVNVSGVSKGKGFAGVVKRWGFHGGPKTHGQSDRHRAPGSIGMGTTPGRVFKGKKMAGRMGTDNVTIQNLEIIDITNDGVLIIKGLVPGIKKGLLFVNKTGEDKNFVPLFKEVSDKDEAGAKVDESEESQKTIKEEASADKESQEEIKTEAKEESNEEVKADSSKSEKKSEEEIVENDEKGVEKDGK